MPGLFNIDPQEAQNKADWRKARSDLKPVGLYEVQPVKAHFFAEEGKSPLLSIELKVLGLLDAEGGQVKKNNGDRVYAGSRLFFKAYLTAAALFSLENIQEVMVAEDQRLVGSELAEKLNSVSATQAKLLAWVNTWLDTEGTYLVWVSHDLKGSVPSEKVSFRK